MIHINKPVIFLGPSWDWRSPGADRELLESFHIHEPAQRGDILKILGWGASTIVLVDGLFHSVPSVTHKELLYALQSGVRLLGSSSMGALRAAEMAAFGMEPHGRIAHDYVRGTLEGDDEVALLHGPEGLGYAGLTIPLVEVRYCLERLVDAGYTTSDVAEALVVELRKQCFTMRSEAEVARAATKLGGSRLSKALIDGLRTYSQKRDDAKVAMRAAMLERPIRPDGPNPEAPDTVFLGYFKERYIHGPGLGHILPKVPQSSYPTLQEIYWCFQVFDPKSSAFAYRIRRRHLLEIALRLGGGAPSASDVAQERLALEAFMSDWISCARLPAPEIEAEARSRAAAASAGVWFGSEQKALDLVAAHFGLAAEKDSAESLIELAEYQYDFVPSWVFHRSFAFDPAYHASARIATDLVVTNGLFSQKVKRQKIGETSVMRMVAEHWRMTDEAALIAEAAKRGLYPAVNLFEALTFVAPLLKPST